MRVIVCPSCTTQIYCSLDSGEPMICAQCRAFATIDTEVPGGARMPTDEEELAMLRNPRIKGWAQSVADYHAEHGPPMSKPPDSFGP